MATQDFHAAHGGSASSSMRGKADDDGQPRHSRELARQLVRRLGVQGATRTCIENHWQGVLDIIQAMNRKQ